MTFDYQPILSDDIIKLRPLRQEDFDDLFAVASDPNIWEQHPTKTRYKSDGFRDFFNESLTSGGALVAIDASTGHLIGSSRFHGYEMEKSEVEIGWTFLARSYWGGVYNGHMKKLMLEHAFQYVEHVVFLVGPQNIRSQRAVEKIGGVKVGMRPDATGANSMVFQIDSETFSKRTG